MTKKEATEKWVGEFNAIPLKMFDALWTHAGKYEGAGWQEVTKPRVGDMVYHEPSEEIGEILSVDGESNEFKIRLENDIIVLSKEGDLSRDPYSILPMWGTMWSFGDSLDNDWLIDGDGRQAMSDCGFRIYEHEEFGYFFGIDGAGYSFYEQHWIPLYEARGLQWHEQEKNQNLMLTDIEVGNMRYTQEFYHYLQENFTFDGTASRLVRNILEYIEAESFIDAEDARTHLWSLLGGAFGLTEQELLQYQAGEDIFELEAPTSASVKADTMTVLIVESNKEAYEAEIGTGLESLQQVVGGNIQALYPYEEPVALICHEEGKILGLPLNRALYDDYGEMYDIVAGSFILCGLSDDNFASLSPEDMTKFRARFQAPEEFAKINGKIVAIKMELEKSPLRETLAKHAERSRAEFGDQASTPQKPKDLEV